MTEEDSSALKVLADCTIDLPSSRFRLPVVAMNESKFSATMTMAPQFADTCKKKSNGTVPALAKIIVIIYTISWTNRQKIERGKIERVPSKVYGADHR